MEWDYHSHIRSNRWKNYLNGKKEIYIMKKGSTTILGLLFIIIGSISILNYVFGMHLFEHIAFWPLFVLVPGLCFEYSYFSTRRAPGLLVPGGILTTLGCLFIFESNTNFIFAAYTWPVYVLAPAIGLLQLYLFGSHEKGLLIPIAILMTVAAVSFANIFLGSIFHFINSSLIWPVVLIVLGILLLFRKKENLADEYDKKKYE